MDGSRSELTSSAGRRGASDGRRESSRRPSGREPSGRGRPSSRERPPGRERPSSRERPSPRRGGRSRRSPRDSEPCPRWSSRRGGRVSAVSSPPAPERGGSVRGGSPCETSLDESKNEDGAERVGSGRRGSALGGSTRAGRRGGSSADGVAPKSSAKRDQSEAGRGAGSAGRSVSGLRGAGVGTGRGCGRDGGVAGRESAPISLASSSQWLVLFSSLMDWLRFASCFGVRPAACQSARPVSAVGLSGHSDRAAAKHCVVCDLRVPRPRRAAFEAESISPCAVPAQWIRWRATTSNCASRGGHCVSQCKSRTPPPFGFQYRATLRSWKVVSAVQVRTSQAVPRRSFDSAQIGPVLGGKRRIGDTAPGAARHPIFFAPATVEVLSNDFSESQQGERNLAPEQDVV